jgi:hypothetical protein
METVRILEISSLEVSLLKTNPPSLHIVAKGKNGNSNTTNIRLEPRVYIVPPPDGIWEFDFVGDRPQVVDGVITPVSAEYNWKHFPESVKGIKVYASINSKVALLSKKDKAPSTLSKIELLSAEAWVDTQPIQPTAGGTLHVNITYNSNNPGFHGLRPAVPQGINPKILILEITDSPEMIFIFNPRHNSYSQGLSKSNQYSSIELVYEGETIGTIKKIPIIS